MLLTLFSFFVSNPDHIPNPNPISIPIPTPNPNPILIPNPNLVPIPNPNPSLKNQKQNKILFLEFNPKKFRVKFLGLNAHRVKCK